MSITSYAPRTGEALTSLSPTTPAELARITAAAARAAAILLDTSPAQRRAWLDAIADALETNLDELVELADRETALGSVRLQAEIGRIAGAARFYGGVAVEGSYLGLAVDDAEALVRISRPIGPVAVFGASNFPFVLGLVGHDTMAAIAAGCPVVGKAHSAHLGLSLRLNEIVTTSLAGAGAPDGTFGMVTGRQAGIELVRDPVIAAVAFTGSESGGRAIWQLANEREVPIPVYAEMGTVNPVVVTPAGAADIKSIAAGFVDCYTFCAGQYCTKPGLFFAPAGSDAVTHIGAALQSANPQPIMLTETIANSVRSGLAELAAAGARSVVEVDGSRVGWSSPAALLAVPIGALVAGSRLLEECFGAVALVCEYGSVDELLGALSQLQPSLVAAVWAPATEPDPAASAIVAALSAKVGRIVLNGWTTGATHSWAQHHGGPWPATSNGAVTSIGSAALDRFVRPIAFQGMRDDWLPAAAQRRNPWQLNRRVNGSIVLGAAPA